jgi:regulator of protease activity HflC (stomatin/prohibitin superfamily)
MSSSKSPSALSEQIKSRIDKAQAELAAAEAKIHAAELAEEEKLQAETQAEIAALQAKATSALAAAQADFNQANLVYAQILALDQAAIANQLPGGNAKSLDTQTGSYRSVDSQTGFYEYTIAGT